MANLLPILALGGAALLLVGKKKKPSSKKKSLPRPPEREEGKDEDLDEEDGAPEPQPEPEPVPHPPEPDPGPAPDPGESDMKPPIGPSGVGSCANSIYNRDPEYLTPEITVANKAMAMFPNKDYFFYLRGGFQKKLYNYMLQRFTAMKNNQERRTVASVVLREGLKHFNSGCKWEVPIGSLSDPEQLVWQSAARLAVMAQVTAGIEDPGYSKLFQTGKRYTITRDSLGEPDPGFGGSALEPGRRVEILATDSTQENAEHLIGEVVKWSGPQGEQHLFEVRILDKFQGVDVEPRLRTKHGFKKGSNAFFSKKGPTGIYRIFPQGMT